MSVRTLTACGSGRKPPHVLVLTGLSSAAPIRRRVVYLNRTDPDAPPAHNPCLAPEPAVAVNRIAERVSDTRLHHRFASSIVKSSVQPIFT